MSIATEECEQLEMNRRERDRLKVLYGVIQGERSQKEAARLLRLTTRQVRRLVRRLQAAGDQGLSSIGCAAALPTVAWPPSCGSKLWQRINAAIRILVPRWPARSWRSRVCGFRMTPCGAG